MSLSSLLNALHDFYSQPILAIGLIIFLIIATYTDIKYLIIPHWLNLSIFIFWLVTLPFGTFSTDNLWGGFIGFISLLIPAMIKYESMGGDIRLATVLGLSLGTPLIIVLIALSCFYGMTFISARFILLKKVTKEMPFAPCFCLAYLTLYGLHLIF